MAIKRHVVSYKDNELEQWLAQKVKESSADTSTSGVSAFYKNLALREFRREQEQEQAEQVKEKTKTNYIDNLDIF